MNLKEVIDWFDLEGYVRAQWGVQVQAHEWLLTCPMCGKEKLAVNTERRKWHCWVCEEQSLPDPLTGRRRTIKGGGGVVSLVQTLEGCDRRRALEIIVEASQPPTADLMQLPELELNEVLYFAAGNDLSPTPIQVPEHWLPVYDGLPYLAERDITIEQARSYGLIWCQAGRYRHRLVFPVWEQGVLVYYQARAMWHAEDQPGRRYIKSLNPPKEQRMAVSSEVLLNLDQARHYPRVAVVEGPIDAVKTGLDAICTFGKRISSIQVTKLLRAGVQALDLMWDGPSPREPHGAWPEMLTVAPMLAALFDVRLVFLPQGDPGDYTQSALTEFRQRAVPVSQVSHLATV